MKIETIETAGFVGAFESLRLPFKKECRSVCESYYDVEVGLEINYTSSVTLDPKDIALIQSLIRKGDEHSKTVRLMNATARINAPLFWWSEENTYTSGVTRGCSESTMHTLKKEKLSNNNFEYPLIESELFLLQGLITRDVPIEFIKSTIPNGYLQERVINYNYQTLRRIWLQRSSHKLPQWHIFIDWIKTLPFANELIFIN
jgi:hypothetical protein